MPSITALADRVRAGERVDADQALELYLRAPTALLGRLADEVRARKHPDRLVTYIIDRNVNYTNVCVAKCNFCAFYRPVGSPTVTCSGSTSCSGRSTKRSPSAAMQLLMQGGHNPICRSPGRRPVPRDQGPLSVVQAARAVAARK
jgi:cyclic dehypoxanthinyl futalosine synthase